MVAHPRDLSRAQFVRAMERYGFRAHGVFGYWSLPVPCHNTSVSEYNGGDRLRSRLAYMLNQWKRELERRDKSNLRRPSTGVAP